MSSLLEEAIVDAKALKEAALKNAENAVLEKYSGDVKKALDLQMKAFPLVKALFKEVNPIPVKAALKLLGFNMGGNRLPLCDPSEETMSNLKREMIAYGFDIL